MVETGGTDWLTPAATLLAVIIGGLLTRSVQVRLANTQATTEQRKLDVQLEAEGARFRDELSMRREEAEREVALRREEAEAEVALRREQAEAEAAVAARIEAAEIRAAARVIQADLSTVASQLKSMVEDDLQWWVWYRVALPHWDHEQRTLAKALTTEAWDAVSQSAWALRAFDQGMHDALASGGPHAGAHTLPLSPAQRAAIARMWDDATTAWNALASHAGVQPMAGRLHAETDQRNA